jgi:hypothetical protein
VRFTIPGDGAVRPNISSGKRDVRCTTFQIEAPSASDMAMRAERIGCTIPEAIARSAERLGLGNFMVYGLGKQVADSGKDLSANGISEQIDLAANPEIADAVLAALPGEYAASVEAAKDAYEAAIAKIAADQETTTALVAALALIADEAPDA